MKSQLTLASLMIAICALGNIFLPAQAQDDVVEESAPAAEVIKATAKWQHLALQHDASKPFSTPDLARKINQLGEDGWEMINVLNFQKEGTTNETVYYFKRPL